MAEQRLKIRYLGLADYGDTWSAMKKFTCCRDAATVDQLWMVEHPPVFTQGQAGKPEHVLTASDIPVVQTDRGGQVTYHGPGQLVVYPLLDLKRLKVSVRELVTKIENSVVELLQLYSVESEVREGAPGVYVASKKIASLGLRVRRGCCFHGVAINISADLSAFEQINPCGYPGLQVVNLQDLVDERVTLSLPSIANCYAQILARDLELSLER